MKHSCYDYEIFPWQDTTNPDDTKRYVYIIDGDIESDEWYYTEADAVKAACDHINALEEGPSE